MTVKISCNWLDREAKRTADELRATLAALRIIIDDKNVTTYADVVNGRSRRGLEVVEEKLHIPVYFLAEWIAENWWPLLYEPRKSDKTDGVAFYSRHSILHAQHGFALPDVQIEPLGDAIRVSCRPHEALAAGVKFRNSAATKLAREAIEPVLHNFLKNCVDRLSASGVTGTPLQKAWREIQTTEEAQLTFCKLVGSLGINPYGASPEIADLIDRIYDALGPKAACDLCLASTEEQVFALDATASFIADKFSGPHNSTLEPLEKLRLEPAKLSLQSWQQGKAAALNVRKLLEIKSEDQFGADKLFDKLKISTASNAMPANDGVIFSGAVDRVDADANFVLLQSQEEARRFAASRAVFLALSSDARSRRLVTDAITRDQQASRAFAAEILVPLEYLKGQARRHKLSRDQVLEIARQRRAGVDVVQYQATNYGMLIEASI